jgi:hypothetical protein
MGAESFAVRDLVFTIYGSRKQAPLTEAAHKRQKMWRFARS